MHHKYRLLCAVGTCTCVYLTYITKNNYYTMHIVKYYLLLYVYICRHLMVRISIMAAAHLELTFQNSVH